MGLKYCVRETQQRIHAQGAIGHWSLRLALLILLEKCKLSKEMSAADSILFA
jgi:hypothetical protein